MNIAHVIPYLGCQMGGPVRALADYAGALVEQGCSVSVVAAPRETDGPPVPLSRGVNVVAFPGSSGGMFRRCPALARHLVETRSDLIHSHGLWTYASYAAGRAARMLPVPHVLAPCGMLQREALERSAWKKRLCRVTFQSRVLRDVSCLHAKSHAESQGIRDFGLRNPIAVIPNPVAAPADLEGRDPGTFRSRHRLEGLRLALYVGRIHPVKGVRRLVEAWTSVSRRYPEWHLAVVGPDEARMIEELQSVHLRGLAPGARPSVSFLGLLDGRQTWQAYRAADLFVMPSDFESFGSAIVEAMSAGLPVITTTGTPWMEVRDQRAGWWVERTTEAVALALADAMSLTDEQLREMGVRARGLTAGFAQDEVGRQLVRLYRWLLGLDTAPAFVTLD